MIRMKGFQKGCMIETLWDERWTKQLQSNDANIEHKMA